MSASRVAAFVAVCVILLSQTVHSEILNYDNPDCIVDPNIPADEEGNYVDCNTPESLAENRTKCCDIEGAKGCCENKTANDKMIAIGTSIGMVTAAVATTCFVVFWCNPDTMPCLKRCPCKCCRRGTDEFSEMTDLSEEIKKGGTGNQMYTREPDEDEYAPPEKYDMPEELKEKVQDDWWGGAGASAF